MQPASGVHNANRPFVEDYSVPVSHGTLTYDSQRRFLFSRLAALEFGLAEAELYRGVCRDVAGLGVCLLWFTLALDGAGGRSGWIISLGQNVFARGGGGVGRSVGFCSDGYTEITASNGPH